ncbi:RdgB/HAM1 family non-canonical purine NTP pyrophosphatase [Aliikangiella sp. IMCC44653]
MPIPQKPSQIVLASGNQKKLKELTQILAEFPITLRSQAEFSVTEAIEDGLTFVENALKKARSACQQTGLPCIADDSGIEVDFLNGQPGIYSARFAGEKASDEDNLQKLLTQMQTATEAERKARYQCVIVYLRHSQDPTPIICQASWEGSILTEKVGDGGFGYDPIFYCPKLKRSAAQLTALEKMSVSHRGKALAQFQASFSQLYA